MAPGYLGTARRITVSSVAVLTALATAAPLLDVPSAVAAPAEPDPLAGVAVSGAPLPSAVSQVTERPGPGEQVTPEPVTPELAEVPVPEVDRPAAPRLAAQTKPQPVAGYGLVGVTWRGDEPRTLALQVRTRENGSWSGWEELPFDDDHAPDPGTAEAAHASRIGSDALVVGDVDAVQLRATSASGEAPRDLELSIVDPGEGAADAQPGTPDLTATATGAVATTSTGATQPALFTGIATVAVAAAARGTVRAPRPKIFSRKQWGAKERWAGRPDYGKIRAGFVHHTVNANGYSKANVPAIIRGIYAYHTQSLGWKDVGYNFLVDRFGRIWEGRKGGVARPVIGAHTYGYNHEAFAMSAIGNFETARPSSRMIRAYGRLMAWKLGLHGIRAGDRRQWVAGDRFQAINGHRDAGQTACPGRYLYAKLPAIRRAAVRVQNSDATTEPDPDPKPPPPTEPPPPPPVEPTDADDLRDLQADGLPDLVAHDASTGRLEVLAGDGRPGFAGRRAVMKRARRTGMLTGVGDINRDGRPDLLVRNERTRVTYARMGRRDGDFRSPVSPTKRFARMDLLSGVGQMFDSRRPDVIARDARTGRVWLYPGRPNNNWGRRRLLLRDAGGLSMLSGAGDLNGDGKADLVARSGRRLLLYPGNGRGRVGAPRVIGHGWDRMDLAVAGRDVTGDGEPDIVARDGGGRTWIYPIGDNGRFYRRFGGWRSWRNLDRLTFVGDVTDDGNPDLLAETGRGHLVVMPSRGRGWLQAPDPTVRFARTADFAQVAGDWNSDGHMDVVTRSERSGFVWLYRGGDEGLRRRVRLTRGAFGGLTDLVAPGDISGDGHPDLVARNDKGIWVYPGNGRTGRKDRYKARESMFRTDMVVAAGRWNNDSVRDLIVRRVHDRALWLVPGTADGRLGRPVRLTGSFAAYDRIVGVGDFNADRHPDIIARESRTADLWLFAGSSSGLQPREFVAENVERFDLIG